MFNNVQLIGNLTANPELKYIGDSKIAKCEFSLAVNKSYKDKNGNKQKQVSFIQCEAWKRTAEILAEYVTTKRPIMVTGELEQQRWKDKETGKNRSRLVVRVGRLVLLNERNVQSHEEAHLDMMGIETL